MAVLRDLFLLVFLRQVFSVSLRLVFKLVVVADFPIF